MPGASAPATRYGSAMAEFLIAFAVFLVAHAVPTRAPVRGRLVAALGERTFQLTYSVLSVVLLAWLVAAAARAPYIELWAPARWHMVLAMALMPVAFVLVAIGFGVANPRSISLFRAPPGWRASGLLRRVRHPLLVGLALWSALHALANGALVSLLLFGGLAVFAIAGVPLVERRRRRKDDRPAAERHDNRFDVAAELRRQQLAAVAGLVAMAVLLWWHPALFGADPLAWL